LAYALPYRRFTDTLTGASARLGADAVGYSFTVGDFHLLLFAGFDRRTKNQDFRKDHLPKPVQQVTLSERYDRIRTSKSPPWLCPRQHLRTDARRPNHPTSRRGMRQDLPREGKRRA